MKNIQQTTHADGVEVTFDIPTIPTILAGHYHLFLVSSDGVPSVAKHTIITRPNHKDTFEVNGGNKRIKLTDFEVALIALIGFIGTCLICFGGRFCYSKIQKRKRNNSEKLVHNNGDKR